jgi:Fibronectin type III domain
MRTSSIARIIVRFWIAYGVAAFMLTAAHAQTPDSNASAPQGQTTTQANPSDKKAPSSEDLCPADYPPATPRAAETPHGTMKIQPDTRWQPVGGEVRFALTSMEKPPENVAVYFAWEGNRKADKNLCHRSPRVRLLPRAANADDTTYFYAALVPSFGDNSPWIEGWGHRQSKSTVPIADVYVHGSIPIDKDKEVAFILTDTLGISSPWIVYGIVLVVSILAFGVLSWWARTRNIPGGWLLRIISSPNGAASLSQFQIFLWTGVIGVGVVYVMMLSGNLIDIPVATLGLLGVSGLALVGSKLQAGADATPQRVGAPGSVTNLAVAGAPTHDTVVLNWTAPANAQAPFSYTVQMRLSGAGHWSNVASDIGGPPYAVTGLAVGTSFDFQVFAINAGGAGPTAMLLNVPTAAAAAGAPAGTPGQVTGVTATVMSDRAIELRWAPLAPQPDSYSVQYRKAGTLPWATASTEAVMPATVGGLDSGREYEFQIFAVTGGNAGAPSGVVAAKTIARTPRWSDLVMSGDDNTQVDLARLQMLVFTSIAALFTALTLFNTGEIPDIPIGELALVGVSNGVYLASKVAGR